MTTKAIDKFDKSKGGRPAFEPTKEQRAMVKQLAAFGTPHEAICAIIMNGQPPIDVKTLKKHFAYELDNGLHEATAKVAGQLVKQALDGNLTAAIFWLKTRGGWRESPQEVELSGGRTPIGTTEVPVGEYKAALEKALSSY